MKKIVASVLCLSIIALLGGGFFLYNWLTSASQANITSDLSEEAQGRFQKQQTSGQYGVRITENFEVNQQPLVTKCFTVTIPLAYTNERIDDETDKCTLYVSLTNPRGQLVIQASSQSALPSLDEHTGVMFRTQNAEYTELFPKTSFSELKAFQSSSELTLFILEKQTLMTISFSNLAQVNKEILTAAEQTVANLQLLPVEVK